jgi:hypothetical protein
VRGNASEFVGVFIFYFWRASTEVFAKKMKIPNPRFLKCGYNAWFSAFALVFVCLPLLNAAIEGILVRKESTRLTVTAWVFLALMLCGAAFLVKEFSNQFRYWLRERRGLTPREDTLLDTSRNK